MASDRHLDSLTCTEAFLPTDWDPLLPGKLFAHHWALVACNKQLATFLTAGVPVRPVSPGPRASGAHGENAGEGTIR